MNLIEITAALCGLTGTLLLATKGRWAGWGFVAFLGSNAGWLVFAWQHSHQYMFIQQLGFTVSSLLGIWVWLIKPQQPEPAIPVAFRTRSGASFEWVTMYNSIFAKQAHQQGLQVEALVSIRGTCYWCPVGFDEPVAGV